MSERDANRKCKSCKRTKPRTDFYSKGNGYRDWTCKSCRQQLAEERRSGSIEAFMRNRYTKLKSARKKDFEWSITLDDLMALWWEQKGRCALSGRLMTAFYDGAHSEDQLSVDRIRPDMGYIPNNVQLVCYRANMMKHTLSNPMFVHWCKQIGEFSTASND